MMRHPGQRPSVDVTERITEALELPPGFFPESREAVVVEEVRRNGDFRDELYDRLTSRGAAGTDLLLLQAPRLQLPCQLEVGFVSSTDGGQTWSRPEVLAGPMPLSWLATRNQGAMVGDYISTSVLNVGALALPAFAVAFEPEDDGRLHEAIFTVREEIRGGEPPSESVPR